jgi:hypothetical protein
MGNVGFYSNDECRLDRSVIQVRVNLVESFSDRRSDTMESIDDLHRCPMHKDGGQRPLGFRQTPHMRLIFSTGSR